MLIVFEYGLGYSLNDLDLEQNSEPGRLST